MTKRDLQNLYWAKRNIRKLEDRLADLDSKATKVTTRISDEPRSPSSDSDKMGSLVCKIIDVQNEINYELKRMYEMERDAMRALSVLPDREAYLIRLRYMELQSWESICVEMNYSWKQIHRIHSEALKILG